MQNTKFCHSRFINPLHLIIVLALVAMFLVAACAGRQLPEESPPKTASQSLEPAAEGKLAELAAKIAAKYSKDASALLPMDRNDESLRWRLMLADLAEESIDLQTFIWILFAFAD